MAKAYECDFCGELVREVQKTISTSVVDEKGLIHKVSVVVAFNGGGQGEYCVNCVPQILTKAVENLKMENMGLLEKSNEDKPHTTKKTAERRAR